MVINNKQQKIIINADDFGCSSSVNHAIAQCFEKGLIHRTTIMTNTPYFDDAVRLADTCGFKRHVGLHLVLDEFTPLTDDIKNNPHFCNNGKFLKGWAGQMKNKIYLSHYDISCIKEEIEAQMQAYCDSGFTLMHIDSHHLVHTSSPIIISIVSKLALEYGFKSMRNVAIYHNDNIVKKLAKIYVRNIVEKNFITTKFFAPYNNYNTLLKDVEYMSHPDMFNDFIVDVVNRDTGDVVAFKRNMICFF